MKYSIDIKEENLSTYQMKTLLIFLIDLVAKDIKVDEEVTKIPNEIRKHFKEVK